MLTHVTLQHSKENISNYHHGKGTSQNEGYKIFRILNFDTSLTPVVINTAVLLVHVKV